MISNFFKSKKFFFIIVLSLFIVSNLLVLKNSFKIKNYIKQSILFLYYDNYGMNFLDYFTKRFSGIFIQKKEININIAFENITKLDNDRKNYLNSTQNLNDMSWVPVVLEFEKKKI